MATAKKIPHTGPMFTLDISFEEARAGAASAQSGHARHRRGAAQREGGVAGVGALAARTRCRGGSMSEDGRCKTCGTITNLPPRLTHTGQERCVTVAPNGGGYEVRQWGSDTAGRVEATCETLADANAIAALLPYRDAIAQAEQAQQATVKDSLTVRRPHAEQALGWMNKARYPYRAIVEELLDKSAEIERVAREAVEGHHPTHHPLCPVCRLRALVQP